MVTDGSAHHHIRILALDVGTKRIGMAVTDPLGLTAQGLETIKRVSRNQDLDLIRKVIEKYEITEIVIGLPVRMGGEASAQTTRVQKFADFLRTSLKLPVHLFDERLTSWEAHQILDEQKLDRHRRKGKVDTIAACLILQGFLASRKKL
jgi:putative Holliday junction resolvase